MSGSGILQRVLYLLGSYELLEAPGVGAALETPGVGVTTAGLACVALVPQEVVVQ
jgi:hypothetical protein